LLRGLFAEEVEDTSHISGGSGESDNYHTTSSQDLQTADMEMPHDPRQIISAMAGKMAVADGDVSQEEVNCTWDTFISKIEDKNLASDCEKEFKLAQGSSYTIFQLAGKLRAEKRELREFAYWLVAGVAAADGILDPSEERILKELPAYLILPKHVFEEFKQSFDSQQGCGSYEVLGYKGNSQEL